MNASSKRFAFIAIIAVLATAIAIIFNLQNTGFVLLPKNQQQTLAEQSQKQNIENTQTSKENESNSAQVETQTTFEVIKPTQLQANLLEGKVFDCPVYSELVFEVANIGKFNAQRVFVDFPSDLKVQNCTNCSIKELNAGEKTTIALNACKAAGKEMLVEFSSINAQKKTVKIN